MTRRAVPSSNAGSLTAHGRFILDTGYDPDTGRRRQVRRSGFRTRDDATEAMTRELSALDRGTWTDDHGLRLREWLDQWLEEFADRGRSLKTLALYRSHIDSFWRPQLGHVRLRDLRRSHIETGHPSAHPASDGSRTAGNTGRYVQRRSPTTIDGYRRTLRSALSAARQGRAR